MKRIVLVVMGTILFLVGCGSEDGKELGSIGGKGYTEKEFIGDLVEDADVEGIQGMFLAKILEEKSTDGVKEKVIEEQMEDFEEGAMEDLTDEEEEQFNYLAEQDAGLINVLTESGKVTKEEIEKYHKENEQRYDIDIVVVEDKKEAEEIESILKEGKEVGKELEDIGIKEDYFKGMNYTKATMPEYLPNVIEAKEGDIVKEESEEAIFIVKVNEITKIDLDNVENEIILTLGEENIDSISGFIKEMEEENIIEINKDLREYLKLDSDKVK